MCLDAAFDELAVVIHPHLSRDVEEASSLRAMSWE